MHSLASLLFRLFRVGRCPACGHLTQFSAPVPLLTGDVPAELQDLVPRICQCRRHGCTSSVRAITSLELRTAQA
jgi:hypothetical protein